MKIIIYILDEQNRPDLPQWGPDGFLPIQVTQDNEHRYYKVAYL